jgi:hypothetical protein
MSTSKWLFVKIKHNKYGMIYTSRLDKQPINIDIVPDATYGILLSGGLDSAVLFYLLLDACQKQKITPKIIPFTIPKVDGSYLYVASVISWMIEHFNLEIPHYTLVGDITLHHRAQSASAVKDIFTKFPRVDYVVIGINQNPPEDIGVEGPTRDTKSDNPRVLVPFVNLYKTHIVDLIYEHDLQGLLDITHSCTEQRVGRCMKCFQCRERAWAFEQLDQTDMGTR